MSIDHGTLLALADRIDDVCARMTSKDGFLAPESDPRRLLWQIGDELREAAAAIAKPAEAIDMVTAEHIGGCPFTGTPNSISSCACAWWLAHDAAQPAEAVEGGARKPWAPIPCSDMLNLHLGALDSEAERNVRAGYDLALRLMSLPTDAAQGAVALIVRDCCELDPADPDHPDTVSVSVADLRRIVERYTHPQAAPAQGDGVSLIAAERRRQIDTEGWTTEHDDEHAAGELARAAGCYALAYALHQLGESREAVPAPWPWDHEWWKPTWDARQLVKAGALIAAEIDRLQRTAAPSQEGES